MIVTMPGKMGDALYTLPTIRKLYEKSGEKITFWTSKYCEPLRELFMYQEYIEDFVIDYYYEAQHDQCGIQPWRMVNADCQGEEVLHLGFKSAPNCALPLYIMQQAGLGEKENSESIKRFMGLDYPVKHKIDGEYIVLAPRTLNPDFKELWKGLTEKYKVVSIGSFGEFFPGAEDYTGASFLETVSIIDNAKLFVGTLSSMLALANFTNVRKIVPYDPRWTLSQAMPGATYMRQPSVEAFMQEVEMDFNS